MPKNPEEFYLPMALTGRETLGKCLNVQISDEPDESKRARWLEAAEVVGHVVEHEIETTFDKLAAKCFAVYHGSQKLWEDQPLVLRVAWEGAARSMVNVRQAEDADDLREISGYNWQEWAATRLNQGDFDEERITSRAGSAALS